MAFDEKLTERIRAELKGTKGMVEKQMFGGVAFLLHGNMCVGVHKDEMIARIDAAGTDSALKEKGVRIFDITGRPMKGWVLVAASALKSADGLSRWVSRSKTFAASLPKKKKK